MRARYYNPEIKRFVNRDVVTGSIGNGLTMNRYAYVNGNPVSYIDPFGLSADGAEWLKQGGSFLADVTPVVGSVKAWQQAITGVNYVTGEQLTIGDRVSDAAGGLVGLIPIPGSKYAGKYTVKGLIWTGEKAADLFGWGKKAEKSATKLINECNCFTAGTKVKTDKGEKRIEDVKVGDQVLAKSDETGEVAYKKVTGLFQKQAHEIYYIHVKDEIIEVTSEHPFWVADKGWTFVKDLKVNDLLISSDSSSIKIEKIEKEPREATVYNFEVQDFSSYFVSNLGIWVHNCDINPTPNQLLGIEAGGGNPRSALNDKIRAKSGVSSKQRHLTTDEKTIANQILNDITDSKNGDVSARQRLIARGDHRLENRASSGNYYGWNSVYVGTTGGVSNIVRIIYKETDDGIKWNVVIWH